jgi:hypothetical protein
MKLEPIHPLILVTGSPRSGTKFTATVLRNAGLDVVHESVQGKDGTASPMHLLDASDLINDPYKRRPRESIVYQHVFHQLRDPLRSIPSLKTVPPVIWDWARRYTGIKPAGFWEPTIDQCAEFWLIWTGLIEEHKPEFAYRVEDFLQVWPEIAQRLDVPKPDQEDFIRRLVRKQKSRYERAKLDDFRPDLADRIAAKIEQYGYWD